MRFDVASGLEDGYHCCWHVSADAVQDAADRGEDADILLDFDIIDLEYEGLPPAAVFPMLALVNLLPIASSVSECVMLLGVRWLPGVLIASQCRRCLCA
jgi:hypothetical protein